MTKGYSPSSLAKPRVAALIPLAVLLLTFCRKTFGGIAPFRLKTLDFLFRPVPFAKASPEVVVTVDQPDLDFCKNQADYQSTLDKILKSYRNILEGA